MTKLATPTNQPECRISEMVRRDPGMRSDETDRLPCGAPLQTTPGTRMAPLVMEPGQSPKTAVDNLLPGSREKQEAVPN